MIVFLLNLMVKEFKNRSILGEAVDEYSVSFFLTHGGIYLKFVKIREFIF